MSLTRREFVRDVTQQAALAATAGAVLASRAHGGPPQSGEKPLKVCVLSGCPTYNSEKSLGAFVPWLQKHYQVESTLLSRKAADDLPGLENLDRCDVAFIFIKRMQLKEEQLARFKKYALAGRPIVAVRTASHAVQTWLEFDREVLGGNYQGHYAAEPVTQIEVLDEAREHPILRSVRLTTAPGPLYKNTGQAEDVELLMTGSNPGQTEPLTWTRNYKGGRVFYTSLGNVETFEQAGFRRMLAQALFWTAEREPAQRAE